MRFLIPCLFAISALGQVGPDYQRPPTQAPAAFKGVNWRPARPAAHLPKGEWWRVFKDAKLNELEAQATANNQNLKAALARFDQARIAARAAKSDWLPTLSLPLTAERQRTSENAPSPIPLDGLYYKGAAYNALADFNWELDLWGKIRRGVEAGRADAEAAADAIYNLLLGIQADVATHYFRIRALDQEISLVSAAVKLRGEAFQIARARVLAGAGSELEEAQSETEVASAEAEISALKAERDQLENAIAILIGVDASSFRLPAVNRPLPAPPSLPAGAPSDLLERRPDIAQAERQLAAATARIGVAKAHFFPSVRLIGRGGYQSAEFNMLMEPAALIWNYGPNVSIPIFNAGRNRLNFQRSKAIHDEALAGYRQAFLAAVADVETSLSTIRNLSVQAEAQQRARVSAERAAYLAKTRYEAGSSPYLDVIESNRTVLAMQRATSQVAGRRLIASVSLIKALGGGWDQNVPVALPEVTPDPAARSGLAREADSKSGFFSKVKGLFKRRSTQP